MGELKATRDPAAVLVAYGLGSCVGVSLYDRRSGVAGLAHVMLPSSQGGTDQRTVNRFANRAVPALVDEISRLGGDLRTTIAKIAGGARMLEAAGLSDSFNIGDRNVEAVKAALANLAIPLAKADTGGNRGRTMSMHVGPGRVTVRIIGEKEADL
jgi:chemotaxis protein CheD